MVGVPGQLRELEDAARRTGPQRVAVLQSLPLDLNCALRASDGSTRNCDAAGTGSYSIGTVGDARVMRRANVPAAASTLTCHRLFVERGGKVYHGYCDKLRVDHALRLNAEGS